MSDERGITNVRIIKDPLYKRVISHPFRYYWRAGGLTFCVVAASNMLTTLFDSDRRSFLFEHPQMYFMGLLGKSSYFGLIWPSFYFTAIKSPYSAFVYGGGLVPRDP